MGSEDADYVSRLLIASPARSIVVFVGAGVSTEAGIPDFRSTTGIYNEKTTKYGTRPDQLFDLTAFNKDPRPFYTFAGELARLNPNPTRTHMFLSHLDKLGKLQRVYSQNFDGLELRAGVTKDKVVQLHGNINVYSCRNCSRKFSADDFATELRRGNVLYCTACNQVLRPDIVFFGEKTRLDGKIFHSDCRKAELLLVIGTSLKVSPVCEIVQEFQRRPIPRILINKTKLNAEDAEEHSSEEGIARRRYPRRTRLKWNFTKEIYDDCNEICESLQSKME